MKHFLIYTCLLVGGALLASCEDVIHPSLEYADPIYVVDAWVTNRPEPQQIKLMRTQPYFDNSLPPGVSGASVSVEDSEGKIYTFTEGTEAGTYIWTPVGNEFFGEVGLTYTLTISVNGETLLSTTDMGQVPVVDSVTFKRQEGNQFMDEIYLAEFWATDPVEVGDAYWIKAYKNGELLNKPADINLAYDAAFQRGGDFSGVAFITPIRTAVNPIDLNDDGTLKSPFVLGDSLYVEINSLSEGAFDFLNEVIIQTDRPGGFGELFSTPLANVSTNIQNANTNGTAVVGFFNVAAVAGLGRKFSSLDDLSED